MVGHRCADQAISEAAFELVHDHEVREQSGNFARVKIPSARHRATGPL
jgi:hypothetical protein